jgi:nicotinamide riboside kinase
MILIGLVGTAGCGKTTLAKAYADATGNGFIKTSTSEVFKKHNLDPKVRMTMQERLIVQNDILDTLLDQWLAHESDEGVFITDRTPYCMITFTLAEVSGYGSLDPYTESLLSSYIMRCHLAARAFASIIHVPMGIPLVADPTGKVRASGGVGYNAHYDLLLKGLLKERMFGAPHSFYELSGTDLAERVQQTKRIVASVLSDPM